MTESEGHISNISKESFVAVQVEGAAIFETTGDSITEGFDSNEVQEQIIRGRKWLEYFLNIRRQPYWNWDTPIASTRD